MPVRCQWNLWSSGFSHTLASLEGRLYLQKTECSGICQNDSLPALPEAQGDFSPIILWEPARTPASRWSAVSSSVVTGSPWSFKYPTEPPVGLQSQVGFLYGSWFRAFLLGKLWLFSFVFACCLSSVLGTAGCSMTSLVDLRSCWFLLCSGLLVAKSKWPLLASSMLEWKPCFFSHSLHLYSIYLIIFSNTKTLEAQASKYPLELLYSLWNVALTGVIWKRYIHVWFKLVSLKKSSPVHHFPQNHVTLGWNQWIKFSLLHWILKLW